MRAILYLIIFLCIFSTVAAKPLFESTLLADDMIEIIYPKFDFYPFGTNITFPFHVFNSTGSTLTNTTTECEIHVYDKYGNAILEEIMDMMDNDIDYYVILTPTELSYKGVYSYIVQCTNNNESGFVSTSFDVSDEKYNIVDSSALIALVMGIGVICFIFLYFAFSLDKEHFLLKLLLIFFSMFTLMYIPAAVINGAYITATKLIKIPLAFFSLFVIYFVIYLSWHWLRKSEQFCKIFNMKK